MSMRTQRDRILKELGGEAGKVNDNHVFLVKNLEKRLEKQYWVAVPGSVISMFITGAHEWKYLGPKDSEAVKAKIAEIDKAQSHIMGEQLLAEVDDFEPDLDLDDLGLGQPQGIPEALDIPVDKLVEAPKGKGKSGDKAK